jgi:hypothetical protein
MLARSLCLAVALALGGCGVSADEQDLSASMAEIRLEGVLKPLLRPGGESTGFGLVLADGRMVEIDLARHELVTSFREGQRVAVSGSWESREGIETRSRVVFVVSSLRVTS